MKNLSFGKKMPWNRYVYVFLFVGLGAILMVGGRLLPAQPETAAAATEETKDFDLAAFQQTVQEKLSMIDGAGRVEVLLSLKSGTESVYASDVRQDDQESGNGTENTSGSSTYESSLSVVSSSGFGQTPVLLKTVYPEFRGAVVICDGADNAEVCYTISQAIHSLCGISFDNISITKMQKDEGGNTIETH